jgi:hypothetical protein
LAAGSLSARRIYCLVCEGDRDRDTILRTQVARDVTFPGRIFDQIDVAWTDCNLLTSRNLDLSSTAERNHELHALPRTDRCTISGIQGILRRKKRRKLWADIDSFQNQ